MTTRCGPIQVWQHESGGFQAEDRRQYQPGGHPQELSGPKKLGRSFDQKVVRPGWTEGYLGFDRDQEPGGCGQVCQKKHKKSKAAACLGVPASAGMNRQKRRGNIRAPAAPPVQAQARKQSKRAPIELLPVRRTYHREAGRQAVPAPRVPAFAGRNPCLDGAAGRCGDWGKERGLRSSHRKPCILVVAGAGFECSEMVIT
jgi:hypothetical protein